MHTTINVYQFRDAFEACGRGEQFTYEGFEVLFDCLEQYEDALGEEIELDVIALCCEYSEGTPAEIAEDYRIDVSDCEDEEDILAVVLKYLERHTLVCGETDTTIVFQVF